jgi:hypothetical protein
MEPPCGSDGGDLGLSAYRRKCRLKVGAIEMIPGLELASGGSSMIRRP